MRRADPETRDCLAAEYALGTLRGPARERFERWLGSDADLRGRVARWEARLAPLAGEAEPVIPPARVWAGIRTRLGLARHPESPHEKGLWGSLGFWRGLAAAAVALLAVVAAIAFGPGEKMPMPERMVVVTDPQSRPVWVISAHSGAGMLRVRTLRSPGMAPERVCPLWLQWGDRGAARRVTILPEERGIRTVKLPPELMRRLPDSRVAVSVEPAEAVPRDHPRGKVVYRGDWIQL